MYALILIAAPFFHALVNPSPELSHARRDYREVICDIDVLLERGNWSEPEMLELVNEIAGGVKDF